MSFDIPKFLILAVPLVIVHAVFRKDDLGLNWGSHSQLMHIIAD